jgi:hypothetical protein
MRASDPVRASSSRPRARYTQPLCIGAVQGHAQAGAGLVGDGMQRLQRLTHSALSAERQFLDRHIGALTKDPPLIGDKVGQWASPRPPPRRSSPGAPPRPPAPSR